MAWDKILGRSAPAPTKEAPAEQAAPAAAAPAATSESEPPDHRREARRSRRVYIVMPVSVRAQKGKDSFQEDTATETVNAHGCMVRLAAAVQRGQTVTLTNAKSGEEVECRVAHIGPPEGKRFQVGLEFAKPAGYFWHIAFPPEDWNAADRKKPSYGRPAPAGAKHS